MAACLVPALTAAPAVAADPTPMLSLAWGAGQAQVSYRKDGRGPDAVCIDDFGGTWVLDAAAHRVIAFTSEGLFERALAINTDAVDLAVAPTGHVYVVNYQDARVHKFGPKGEFMLRYEYPKEIQYKDNVFVFRRFYLAGDDLRLQTSAGEEYTIGRTKEAFDFARIKRSVRAGCAGRYGGKRVRIVPAKNGGYQLVGESGPSFPIFTAAPLSSLRYLDTDAKGRIYATATVLSGPGRTTEELWQFDATGKKLKGVPLQTGSVYQPFRPFEVDPSGVVYQIVGTAERWSLLAYR